MPPTEQAPEPPGAPGPCRTSEFAAVQFEHAPGDKAANLTKIRDFAATDPEEDTRTVRFGKTGQ